MTEIKHIDISEFREEGYLQEANRMFFHPHGLALEITTVDAEGWDVESPRVLAAAERLCGPAGPCASIEEAALQVAVTLNAIYPPGSMHRGTDTTSSASRRSPRSASVIGRRGRSLFGVDSDVEPTDFVYPESTAA